MKKNTTAIRTSPFRPPSPKREGEFLMSPAGGGAERQRRRGRTTRCSEMRKFLTTMLVIEHPPLEGVAAGRGEFYSLAKSLPLDFSSRVLPLKRES